MPLNWRKEGTLSPRLIYHAGATDVTVQFAKADARHLDYSNQFDGVIMVCEGAFPLMETDEMNFDILKNASRALKQRGLFIFTTLNGLFPLFHSVKDCMNEHQDHDSIKESTFDLMTYRSAPAKIVNPSRKDPGN